MLNSNTDASPAPICYSVNGAAAAVSVSRGTIYQYIRDNRLKTVRLGHRTLIPADSLRALVFGEAA